MVESGTQRREPRSRLRLARFGGLSVRRFIVLGSVLSLFMAGVVAFSKERTDTPKAAETRKLLLQKISVEYTDTSLTDVVEDLKGQVKGLTFKLDTAGGVSKNLKISFKGDEKTVAEVLDAIFKKNGCGYIVVSKEGDAYDGIVKIKQGKERGYAVGEEPDSAKGKDKNVADKSTAKDKAKDKSPSKVKTAKAKADDKEKSTDDVKTEDSPDKDEHDAAVKFDFAKDLAKAGKTEKAKQRLEELIEKYPKTKAAMEAKELLKKLSENP